MTQKTLKNNNLIINNNKITSLFHVKYELLKASFLKTRTYYESRLVFNSNHSDLIDKIISLLSEDCFKTAQKDQAPTLVVLGGYGRKELAPHSDIDVLFVQKYPFSPKIKKQIESFTGQLWGMGIKLSASVRTLEEYENDMTEDVLFLTSLLEKRLVWGSGQIYQELKKIFQQHIASSPPRIFRFCQTRRAR